MAKENQAQLAVAVARNLITGRNMSVTTIVAFADAEARVEQARQQELANMIAMLANPTACPYPAKVVLDRIKELTNLG